MTLPGPKAVAVHTDHVAFRRLGEEFLPALERSVTLREGERLVSRVAMVEIHLVAFEAPATIRAGYVPKLPQELRRGNLSPPYAIDLALAVGGVVPDVVGPLARSDVHVSL